MEEDKRTGHIVATLRMLALAHITPELPTLFEPAFESLLDYARDAQTYDEDAVSMLLRIGSTLRRQTGRAIVSTSTLDPVKVLSYTTYGTKSFEKPEHTRMRAENEMADILYPSVRKGLALYLMPAHSAYVQDEEKATISVAFALHPNNG